MRPEEDQIEHNPGDDHSDLNLLAAVGGYHKRRQVGWYLALVLLGFGLGAVLALAVGQQSPRRGLTRHDPATPRHQLQSQSASAWYLPRA